MEVCSIPEVLRCSWCGVLGATGGCVRYLDTSGLERDAVFEIALNSDHEELID